MRTFLFWKPDLVLYGARDACVRVREPSRILFRFDNLDLVLALDKGRSSHNLTLFYILRKVLWVTGAVRSQVLFSLDTIQIEWQRRWISFLFAP